MQKMLVSTGRLLCSDYPPVSLCQAYNSYAPRDLKGNKLKTCPNQVACKNRSDNPGVSSRADFILTSSFSFPYFHFPLLFFASGVYIVLLCGRKFDVFHESNSARICYTTLDIKILFNTIFHFIIVRDDK